MSSPLERIEAVRQIAIVEADLKQVTRAYPQIFDDDHVLARGQLHDLVVALSQGHITAGLRAFFNEEQSVLGPDQVLPPGYVAGVIRALSRLFDESTAHRPPFEAIVTFLPIQISAWFAHNWVDTAPTTTLLNIPSEYHLEYYTLSVLHGTMKPVVASYAVALQTIEHARGRLDNIVERLHALDHRIEVHEQGSSIGPMLVEHITLTTHRDHLANIVDTFDAAHNALLSTITLY